MNIVQRALILCIQAYRLVISPAKLFLFGSLGHCRFTPSCSAFALEAISRHGAWAGSWLALKRLVRCHPWGGCGYDPVPEKKSHDQSPKSKAQTARRCASHPADPRHVSPTRLAAGSFID